MRSGEADKDGVVIWVVASAADLACLSPARMLNRGEINIWPDFRCNGARDGCRSGCWAFDVIRFG